MVFGTFLLEEKARYQHCFMKKCTEDLSILICSRHAIFGLLLWVLCAAPQQFMISETAHHPQEPPNNIGAIPVVMIHLLKSFSRYCFHELLPSWASTEFDKVFFPVFKHTGSATKITMKNQWDYLNINGVPAWGYRFWHLICWVYEIGMFMHRHKREMFSFA